MNFIVGAGLTGLSVSYFYKKDSKLVDFGKGRINTFSKLTNIDLGAQFFSKTDSNFIELIKKLKLEKEINKTNFNKLFIEKNGELIDLNSINPNLSKIEQKEIQKFKNFLTIFEQDFSKNQKDYLNETFNTWYTKIFCGETLWIFDALLKSITFSDSKNLTALYGIIACQSFFGKTYAFNKGMKTVLSKLIENKSIVYSKVNKIEFNNNKVNTITIDAENQPCKSLVSAIPSNQLSKVVTDKELSKNLKKVPYSGCSVLLIKTEKKLTKEKFGLITPENKKIAAILKNQNYYTILAPYKEKRITQKQILKELEDVSKSEVEQYNFWDYGLPTCNLDLEQIQIELLEITNQYNNFAICGDYLGLPSLDSCVESAKIAAEKINKFTKYSKQF